MKDIGVIDLFCGVGGLTHGFVQEDMSVIAGIDSDLSCEYAYRANNHAEFVARDIRSLGADEVSDLFGRYRRKVLVGCAPCQPFSSYRRAKDLRNYDQWSLLREFTRLIRGVTPDVVSMENVPQLALNHKHEVFGEFLENLGSLHYHVAYKVVDCRVYGIPQQRRRLILLASRLGPIQLIPETHSKAEYASTWSAIGNLEAIGAGQVSATDALHVASKLSKLNLLRIRSSQPGGTWRDWKPNLLASCHSRSTGHSYSGVYGRIDPDLPAPTITTQFFGFGSGRFGHPTQDRALSLREGAILQSFPVDYKFVPPGGPVHIKTLGRHIGNAVPVKLGRVIARSIKAHCEQYPE